MTRSRIFENMGRHDEALNEINFAIQLDSRNPDAYVNRAAMLVRHLGFRQALEDLDKAFELDPTKSQIFSNRAAALSGLGEYEKAVSAWTKALDLSPGRALYYLKRGLEWENLERYDLAAEDFLLSLRINPEDIWSVIFLYFSRLESGISGTDELRKNTQSLDLKACPGPIIAFCLGKNSGNSRH